jgi:hypothetical protein
MVTWRELITKTMSRFDENFEDVVHSVSENDNWLDINFDNGYGLAEGQPFTLWTKNRVYFPVQYDGSEWVESVPRNPNQEVKSHIGGG